MLNLFYAGLVTVIATLFSKFIYLDKNQSELRVLIITLGVLVLIIGMDIVILPITFRFAISDILILVELSLVGMFLSFAFEFLIGYMLRRKPSNYKIYTTADNTTSTTDEDTNREYISRSPALKIIFHITMICVSFSEEIILRGIILPYIISIGIPVIISLLITSIAFGINHFFRGHLTVIQKSVAGAVFGILAYQSGFSILIPMFAHAGENYLILLFARIKKEISLRESKK
jgi:membrane protease YdiL (CAAX protease family)